MRTKSSQKVYTIELEYPLGITKLVKVKASKLEIAEDRALKRNPPALGVKRNA